MREAGSGSHDYEGPSDSPGRLARGQAPVMPTKAKRNPRRSEKPSPVAVPLAERLPPVLLAWLVPGAGHYYLRRRRHGLALLATIAAMFVLGLLMQGRMFTPMTGDMFTTIMTYGGYVGDLCNGSLYFLTVWLGYEQEAIPGAVHDYGTKFIVCSGLLNLLAIVDVYEIASGKKAPA